MFKQMLEYDNEDFLVQSHRSNKIEYHEGFRKSVIGDFNEFSSRYRFSSAIGCNNPYLSGSDDRTNVSIGDLVNSSKNYSIKSGNCRTCTVDQNRFDIKSGIRKLNGLIYKKPLCKIKNGENIFHFQVEFRIRKITTRITVSQVKIRTNFDFEAFMMFKFKQSASEFNNPEWVLSDVDLDPTLKNSSIRIVFPQKKDTSSSSFVNTLSRNGIDLLMDQSSIEETFLMNDLEDLSTLLSVLGTCLNPLKYSFIDDLYRTHTIDDVKDLDLGIKSNFRSWPFESVKCNRKTFESFIDSARGKQNHHSLLENIFIIDEAENLGSVHLILDESSFWRR